MQAVRKKKLKFNINGKPTLTNLRLYCESIVL